MRFKVIPLLLLIICFNRQVYSQCSTLGQTPATAFPVCGSSVFSQSSVPVCFNGTIYAVGCDNNVIPYSDLNPYWYKFTCFKSGTLVFNINPHNGNDDYDWQLFDITGRDIQSVYSTDPAVYNAIFVACNWSGTTGNTGTSLGARNLTECATIPGVNPNPPPLSTAPQLKLGHNYLLMISHFSGNGQSGYDLSFNNGGGGGSGSAVITDTTPPHLMSAVANCEGVKIGVKLNKKMQCSSLVADGSDFSISPPLATVIGASSKACSTGFDMDSIVLTLSNALPDGSYTVKAKTGNDDNTVLDLCQNYIPFGDSANFSVLADVPAPFDSLTPVGCAPNVLQLVFKKNIKCSSIAPDGSDFVITGSNPVTVKKAAGNCADGGLSNIILVTLSQPVNLAGNYQVKLVQGNDGNTIIDECNLETPAGGTLNFVTGDTVSAAFTSQLKLGCRQDTIILANDGNNGITNWRWLFDDSSIYTTPNLTRIYTDYGNKSVSLLVSNGICADSSTLDFVLDNGIKANFSGPSIICPQDTAIFKDSSTGKIAGWSWYFGNGNASSLQVPPPQRYPISTHDKYYAIRLVVNNALCYDTAYHTVKVLYNCYIAVPSAFTPNGDGINDYLYPLNAYKATNLEFRVFNRWGQEVFKTKDWTRKWDGTINGSPQASGVYAWYLTYTNVDTGKQYFLKGTTVLIR